jgi:FAD:protein FMN transferase
MQSGAINVPYGEWLCLSGEAFGTSWRVDVVSDCGSDGAWLARLERCIHDVIETIDGQMSLWRADADIIRFNESNPGTRFMLREPMRQVVQHALAMAWLTDGMFDPTLHEAVARWGFGARAVGHELPDLAGIAALTNRPNDWRALELSGATLTSQRGLTLDLCGIAKGYAVDAVMAAVQEIPGAEAALVEIGGELKGWGLRPDGMPWWVQIEASAARDGALTMAALCGWAVATSGGYRRSFSHAGRNYCHTIDPRTMVPITHHHMTATVFDPLCWRADALATALTVMGMEAALDFAGTHAVPCLLTDRQDNRAIENISPELRQWLDTEG